MRIVYENDHSREAKVGDEVSLHNHEGKVKIVSFQKPRSAASSGFVTVDIAGNDQQVYAGVAGLEWIEREDRDWVDPNPAPVVQMMPGTFVTVNEYNSSFGNSVVPKDSYLAYIVNVEDDDAGRVYHWVRVDEETNTLQDEIESGYNNKLPFELKIESDYELAPAKVVNKKRCVFDGDFEWPLLDCEFQFMFVKDEDGDNVLYSGGDESNPANSKEQNTRIEALVNAAPLMLALLRKYEQAVLGGSSGIPAHERNAMWELLNSLKDIK
jgi:hypothetical protein